MAGDTLLRNVDARYRAHCGQAMPAVRYGGEEFLLMLTTPTSPAP